MLARVVRVRRGQVEVVILVVYGESSEEGNVCADEWQAVIRREDVRATEKEKVVCAEGFRVGDVVRSVVVRSLAPFNYRTRSAGASEAERHDLRDIERLRWIGDGMADGGILC